MFTPNEPWPPWLEHSSLGISFAAEVVTRQFRLWPVREYTAPPCYRGERISFAKQRLSSKKIAPIWRPFPKSDFQSFTSPEVFSFILHFFFFANGEILFAGSFIFRFLWSWMWILKFGRWKKRYWCQESDDGCEHIAVVIDPKVLLIDNSRVGRNFRCLQQSILTPLFAEESFREGGVFQDCSHSVQRGHWHSQHKINNWFILQQSSLVKMSSLRKWQWDRTVNKIPFFSTCVLLYIEEYFQIKESKKVCTSLFSNMASTFLAWFCAIEQRCWTEIRNAVEFPLLSVFVKHIQEKEGFTGKVWTKSRWDLGGEGKNLVNLVKKIVDTKSKLWHADKEVKGKGALS